MKVRSAALVSVSAILLTLVAINPAHATPPAAPTLSHLDASTPGHLTGTITSPGAPRVWVRLGSSDPVTDAANLVELSGDSGAMDIPTWGYEGVTAIYLRACVTTDIETCSPEEAAPETFIPIDVVPTSVTWSEDTTVGQNQEITVTVEDEGGGELVAFWVPTGGVATRISPSLSKSGTSSLSLRPGNGAYSLARCGFFDRCVQYPALTSPTYDVRTVLPLTADPMTPISTVHPATVLTLQTQDSLVGADYDVEWYVTRGYDPIGLGGSQPVSPLPTSGRFQIPIDGSQISDDGYYSVFGTVRVRVPEYGIYSQPIASYFSGTPTFVVDRHSAVTAIKPLRSTIYPNIGHSDRPSSTRINVVQYDHNERSYLVISKDGVVFRTLEEMGGTTPNVTWNGRDESGASVPSGTYTVGTIDAAGNTGSVTATIRVDARHRVLKVYTRTVRAKASMLNAYVGACSTLRKPSSRRWRGSLGFYANTRCTKKSWKASAVSTLHGIRLPVSDKDVSLTFKVYGGAAKSRPKSVGWVRYLTTSKNWRPLRRATRHVGTYDSQIYNMKGAVQDDRAFYWGFYTLAGKRYDVARFTVELRYYVMQ